MGVSFKKRVLTLCAAIGLVAVIMVVLTAHAAEVRCDNNELIAANEALQGEIDTLDVKIKAANSVDHIESVAMDQLGMVYPDKESCIYLSGEAAPDEDLAMTIRENAYN